MKRPHGLRRRPHKRRPGVARPVVALLGLAVLTMPAPAMAQQELDANFDQYCATRYPNSSHQRIGLSHYCQQAGQTGGATRHNIDLAEACRMTTGTDVYRRVGSRILCQSANDEQAGGQQDEGKSLSATDFQAYCRTAFPNSAYEKRAESWGVVHYCRRPGATGGFTLQNVDLAQACQLAHKVSDYRQETDKVICGGGAGSRTAAKAPRPKPGPVPGPRPPGPGPAPLPADDETSDTRPQAEQEAPDPADKVAVNGDCLPLHTTEIGESPVEQRFQHAQAEMQELLARTFEHAKQLTENYLKVSCPGPHCNEAKLSGSILSYMTKHNEWVCLMGVVRNAEQFDARWTERAITAACRIQDELETRRSEINNLGGRMPIGPWQEVSRAWGIEDVCNCAVLPDLAALVNQHEDQLEATFDTLQKSLPAPQCPEKGNLEPPLKTFLTQFADLSNPVSSFIGTANAQAVDELLSSEKDIFEGMKFGEFRTNGLALFPEAREIRKLQDEMTKNGGRDNLLSKHSWKVFSGDVARVSGYMKNPDSPDTKLLINLGLAEIVDTRSKINDRYQRLRLLEQKVVEQLSGDDFVEYLEALDRIIKNNRKVETSDGLEAHPMGDTMFGLNVYNLVRYYGSTAARVVREGGEVVVKTAPKSYLGPIVGFIVTMASVTANCKRYLDWSADLNNIERFKKPYLELMDFHSSLSILLEQYRVRLEAQEELIDKLREAENQMVRGRTACGTSGN